MEINRVGIVGFGVMGIGIAQLCARKNLDVIVCETEESLLKKGLDKIRGRIKNPADREKIVSNISTTCELNSFVACDFVIEAVTENLALKKDIFKRLDGICPVHTIFATNTSVLPVVEMAKATQRPEKVVGTHFLTPPQVNPLLEIVKTVLADEATLATTIEFGRFLGKEVIVSNDYPGFIVNRILTPILLNAIRLLEQNIGTKEDIETAVKVGLGLPMGPFALMDLIGLDTIKKGTDAMFAELNDPQYASPVLMNRMVSAGLLGEKSGQGFYTYPERGKEKPDAKNP